jgi:hypothetical protein
MKKISILLVLAAILHPIVTQCSSINIEAQSQRHDARSGPTKKPCESLTLDKLNAQLVEHYRTSTLLFQASSDLSTYESDLAFDLNEIESPRQVDQTQCQLSDRNTTLTVISQRSTCPWLYQVKYREDKFPHFLREAKCTCRTCNLQGSSQLPSKTYGCMPILRRVPVLVRNSVKCDMNGFQTWTPSAEIVNTGCTCSFQKELISI